ncbi:helix-turn-helix transcriptional regulator [Aetokthonos hydrillicola Thurmond2011]|jgi:ribosome-binding protein aMBF1 (putative translation factor)|uniref:Helix-turn-helix transcriptional regulator n=1 Tax=Aetokthonos hydrillicola Thurmond2011 TaxID=2712845 RepID=A0AAP5MBR4_9CYAN|nr:helix-turn-helix transcriptional regulator [Aetokthonos hydrillicola]MBO3459754.1 helix-turn-helix transcriptional regulator [Aetokthonos hydrillicola CCALA 1050]MBW4585187.1 helix-turn-helix transcriptional regulator [Aetokthonos hydrillicola CCALA 1050]MDR9899525.1 helix-turn-helix transcriptional regulator [Aetokthonos hydrillicola Thurmond2011]
MKKTTDAVEIMKDMIGDDPQMHQMYNEATVNADVAQLIYEARTEAGLSQKELAEMIGTTQSVISCLEDADYEEHSLSMLTRIATVLNREVKIALVPIAPHLAEDSISQHSV